MSLLIREVSLEDMGALVDMHKAMGMEYPFPELYKPNGDENPLFVRKMILEQDGKPKMAILARLTAEGYFLKDPGDPRDEWPKFKFLHREMTKALWKSGLEDVSCFPPPELDKSFGKRLISIGWVKEKWPAYCLYLSAPREET